jgi:hypothetical protein
VSILRTDTFTISTIQDLNDIYDQEKQLYDAVSKMAKNACECKDPCQGILSAVPYYCTCIKDNWRNVEDLASCMCVTSVDDAGCKDKIRAKFGAGIQIADSLLKVKEYADKIKDFREKAQEIKKKLEDFKNSKQTCCKK